MTGGAVVLAFVFSAAIGIFFGFYPAQKASKMDPPASATKPVQFGNVVPTGMVPLSMTTSTKGPIAPIAVVVLVLVPFLGNHVIAEREKASVAYAVSLSGYSLIAAVLVLTVMIAPLMIAIFSDGLRSVPSTVVAIGMLGFLLAVSFVRFRAAWVLGNFFEYPVWLIGGFLVPLLSMAAAASSDQHSN